jgi:hypothetical protein
VRSEDAPLVAEVVRDKKLAALKLRTLAPTVLASAKPPGDTVKALRAAGYAPVAENSSGEVVLTRPERNRASHSLLERKAVGLPGVPPAGQAEVVAKLAATLAGRLPRGGRRRRTPRRPPTAGFPAFRPFTGLPVPGEDDDALDEALDLILGGGTPGTPGVYVFEFEDEDSDDDFDDDDVLDFPDEHAMATHIPGLPRVQRQLLAAHIGTGEPVLVEYREGSKARRELVVDPQWQPPVLVGSSPRSDGMLVIPLDKIVRVHS